VFVGFVFLHITLVRIHNTLLHYILYFASKFLDAFHVAIIDFGPYIVSLRAIDGKNQFLNQYNNLSDTRESITTCRQHLTAKVIKQFIRGSIGAAKFEK
jgi:hypothetical protein